jgi:hypothetical protein
VLDNSNEGNPKLDHQFNRNANKIHKHPEESSVKTTLVKVGIVEPGAGLYRSTF